MTEGLVEGLFPLFIICMGSILLLRGRDLLSRLLSVARLMQSRRLVVGLFGQMGLLAREIMGRRLLVGVIKWHT